MQISALIGKGVLDRNANNVGKVADIDVTLPGWTIDHLEVKVGLVKKLSVSLDQIDRVGDKIILKVTKDELEKSQPSAR